MRKREGERRKEEKREGKEGGERECARNNENIKKRLKKKNKKIENAALLRVEREILNFALFLYQPTRRLFWFRAC